MDRSHVPLTVMPSTHAAPAPSGFSRFRTLRSVEAAIIFLLAAIFLADILTPLEHDVWVFYVIPIWLALWINGGAWALMVGAVSTALISVGWLWAPAATHYEVALLNRFFGAAAVWTAVILLYRRRRVEREYFETEKHFRLVADSTPIMVWATDPQGAGMYYNKSWLQFVGMSLEQALNNGWQEGIHPDDSMRVLSEHAAAFERQAPLNLEFRKRSARGEYRWLFCTGVPRFDGRHAYMGHVCSCVDITERKQAEERQVRYEEQLEREVTERTRRLEESNAALAAEVGRRRLAQETLRIKDEQFSSFMMFLPAFAWIKNGEGKYLFVNRYFVEAFGFSNAEQVLMKHDRELFPADTAEQFVRNDAIVRESDDVLETIESFQVKNEVHYGLVRKFPLRYGVDGALYVGGTAIDITERHLAEARLRSAHKKLQNLTRKLVQAEEDERRRISRELHDEFSQSLTGLKFSLVWMSKQLTEHFCVSGAAELIDETRALEAMTDQMIAATRRIATGLRPSILDELGVLEAIRWLAKTFQNRTGISLELLIDPELETAQFGDSQSITIFRVTQELLTNIERHAGAAAVRMTVMNESGRVHLRVKDDGRGLTTEQLHGGDTLGVRGIQERVRLLGGRVQFKGAAGKGTTVDVWLPNS